MRIAGAVFILVFGATGCKQTRCGMGTTKHGSECVAVSDAVGQGDTAADLAGTSATGDDGGTSTPTDDGAVSATDGGTDAAPVHTYTAYRTAGGAFCGFDGASVSVYCLPGDLCTDGEANTCAVSDDGTYEAYRSAGGGYCGLDSVSQFTYCKPGDTCTDELECKNMGDGSYDAYKTAGGALCGTDPLSQQVYCKPGDTCGDDSKNFCQH